ncbi:hypothetical protein KP509_11G036200 [Ceratopteris richardii]|nr:hypothetical protein KP509_11G036200 [Ceratopteris richardii]
MNLHLFYCHVTARGGLEQVIRASQWLELAEVLDSPKDIQNVSFVLRKLYTTLLFHYEQVYYFRMEGLLQVPPVSLPAPNPVEETADDASPYEILPELKASYKKKKRKLNPMQVFGVDPAASLGSTAPGVINGKFEEGYFVTVVVGTEKLSGVLYHVASSNNMQQHAGIPSLIDRIGSNGNGPGMEVQLYGCKKRAYVRKTNPDAPKRTRTAYNIFFKEQRAKLERLYPDGKGHGKTVIEMWNKLTDKERAPYIARGSQEREKYLAEHRERLRLQQEQGLADPHSMGIMQSSEDYNHTGYDGSHDYHVSLDVDDEIYVENVDVPGMDQAYQGYHEGEQVDASTEPAMSHLVPEQAYETCENQGEYPGGRFSDEAKETDDGVEEQYEPGEEHTYPVSSNIDEGQGRHEYHVPEPTQEERRHDISQGSDVPEDVYCPQTDNVEVRETEVDGGGVAATKLPFYAQEHAYNYPSVAHQPQMEGVHDSRHMAPYEQMPYQMHENGHVLYPHSQQRQPDAGQDTSVPQHQLFRHNRYGFEQARLGQMGETMGLPVSQDEGSFQRQGDGSPFLASLQQNQAIGSNSHGHQMSTELAYQERYTYPLPLPYPQVYAQPTQAYELRFPHPRYPMQMNEGASSRYGHTYRPQMHHSVTSDLEASGVRPSQVYQQGGAHVSQFQDGSSPSVFKHSTQ